MNRLALLLLFCCAALCLLGQPSTAAEAQQQALRVEQAIYNDQALPSALQQNAAVQVFWRQQPPSPARTTGLLHAALNEAAASAQQKRFKTAAQQLAGIDPTTFPTNSRLLGRYRLIQAWINWASGQYDTAVAEADSAYTLLLDHNDLEGALYAGLIGSYAASYSATIHYEDLKKRLQIVYETGGEKIAPEALIYRYLFQLHGSILYQQGAVESAIDRYLLGLRRQREAMKRYTNGRDSLRLAQYYHQLGRLYSERGNIDQSSGYYEQALGLYEALNAIGEQLKLTVRLAQLQEQQGNRYKLHYYTTRLPHIIKRYNATPTQQRRTKTYTHLAQAFFYQQTRQPQALLNYYRIQLPAIEREGLAPHRAHQYMAWAHLQLDDATAASRDYQRALALVQQRYGPKDSRAAALYQALAQLAWRQNDHVLTRRYLDLGIAQLAFGAGVDFAPEQYLEPKRAALLYQQRAQLALAKEDHAAAQRDLDCAIALLYYGRRHYVGDAAKLLSAQRLRPLYEQAALCAWHQYAKAPSAALLEQLFGYTERSKGSALQESLLKYRNRYAHKGEGVPTHLLDQEEALLIQLGRYKEHKLAARRAQRAQDVAQYEAAIFETQEELQALERQLSKDYPHYQAWQQEPHKSLTLAMVQQTLKEDQVLIEYFLTDSLCLIWYISPEQAELVYVEDYHPKKLKQQVDLLHNSFSDVYRTEHDSTLKQRWIKGAYAFYKKYVQHPMLEGKQSLVVVPDGGLYYIPFEALLTESVSSNAAYRSLPYLLRQYAVHYHYSASLLDYAMQQEALPSGKILGFAASYGSQNDYQTLSLALQQVRSYEEVQTHNSSPPIPGTLEELNALERQYQGHFLEYDEANERMFKSEFNSAEFGVVHLAMHGLVDYREPAYSSLVFTENLDELEDNLLYAYEIQHLQGQQVNLVVLSACKTGYGRYAKGEGIISLGRSFMQAGAPSVVMTLWEINDASTADLMVLFYEGLANGLPKNKALQQAKLAYINAQTSIGAHPFFWASAICIGNPAPIAIHTRHPFWMIALILIGLLVAVGISWKFLLH